MTTTPRTGFLEEAPGVKSATRLLACAAGFGGFVVLLTCIFVATRDSANSAGIIAALSAASAGAFAGAWAAIKERA